MSGNGALTQMAQELISQYWPTLSTTYFSLSGLVFLLYDYILTLPLEVAGIWNGNFTITKLLFLINRYLTIIYSLFYAFWPLYTPVTDAFCRDTLYAFDVILLIVNVNMNVIFILRTYAIYERSNIILVALLIPTVSMAAASIWEFAITRSTALPPQLQVGPFACQSELVTEGYDSNLLNIVSNIVFDALVVILTVNRTFGLLRRTRDAGMRSTLGYILIRDGLLYYCVVFLPFFVGLGFNIKLLRDNSSGDQNLNYAIGDFTNITDPLEVVMVNRLVLNLCNSVTWHEDNMFRTRTGFDPPTFASQGAIGNIGAPVRMVDHSDEDSTEYELSQRLRRRTLKDIELSTVSEFSQHSKYSSALDYSEDAQFTNYHY